MPLDESHPDTICPDPLVRSPRIDAALEASASRLWLAPPALQGALAALVMRDTSGLALTSAQRLTHLPASPLVCISWNTGFQVSFRHDGAACWTAIQGRIVISGSQSCAMTSWTEVPGRGYMACFNADAARALFKVDLAAIQDCFTPVEHVIDASFASLWEELLAPGADALAVLERHLAPRWQALQGRDSATPSLRQLGRHWVEKLAWQAHTWHRDHGPRQVERRMKAFSGRSLREWQSLVKTEGLFFAARDRYESGQPIDWAGLALDQGFADQAHMSRTAKRITGFSPTEFAERFENDESFWLYRLWM